MTKSEAQALCNLICRKYQADTISMFLPVGGNMESDWCLCQWNGHVPFDDKKYFSEDDWLKHNPHSMKSSHAAYVIALADKAKRPQDWSDEDFYAAFKTTDFNTEAAQAFIDGFQYGGRATANWRWAEEILQRMKK